ncbi:MAG: hypothetical protein Q8R57_05275 [Bacteroidota bacterium]|nr:hypothetical protein [Bacteroidota bacterium]
MIYSCSFDNERKTDNTNVDSLKTKGINHNDTAIKGDSSIIETSEKLNWRDENGLKQGKWIKKLKGKIIEIANYKNDTLNGYFQSFEKGGGYEGNYINGKREGMFKSWYVYKKSLLSVVFCINDSLIWMGFPAADEKNLCPVKGFHIERDSVFISAPHENGKIWYVGHFCLLPSKNRGHLTTYAYGTHKIYFRNGRIRGIVDYSKELIQEFDSTGKELYIAKFDNYNLHNQTIIRKY